MSKSSKFSWGLRPQTPGFLLNFELITNFVIIFTILAVKMKSLTFSKAFILTLTILQVFVTGPDPLPTGNTSHQGVNDDTTDANTNHNASDTIDAILTYIDNHAVCQKPAAGADFGGCFLYKVGFSKVFFAKISLGMTYILF